jgi:TonB-linked SusC/RagA family outer membrane protein
MQKKWLTGFLDWESQKKLCKITKLTTLLLVCFVMTVSANSYSQKTKLNVNLNNTTIKDLFGYIEQNSEFVFLYRSEDFNTTKKVSIEAKDATIKEILDQALKDEKVDYDVYERQVVIRKAGEVTVAEQQPQKKAITGTVRDSKGQPLPGATISIKGTTNGVTSDAEGKFKFNVPADAKILVFSFIGMKAQEVPIANTTVFNVVMKEESLLTDEVMVVGYGTQKKGSVVGSFDKVKPAELKLPTRTVSTSLAGRLAGIIAVQPSGEPGYDGATFWIRGINTFAGTTTPLILVDGVERNIDGIDPDEISDFTILKDATATAVYGVRGANGVVLVTTKRGSIGKPVVNFRFENGLTSPLQLPKFVDGPTYMQVQNEALINSGSLPIFTAQQIERTRSGYDPYYYPNVNWMDELIKPVSASQHATVNVSGGSEKMRYFVSGAYINQDGMYKSSNENSFNSNVNLKRYNFRTNIDMSITQSTTLTLNLAGSLENRNYPGASASDIFNWTQLVPPVWYPARYPDKTKIPGYPYGTSRSPEQLLSFSGYSTEYYSRVQSNMTLSQQLDFITKGLSAKFMYSFDAQAFSLLDNIRDPYKSGIYAQPPVGCIAL